MDDEKAWKLEKMELQKEIKRLKLQFINIEDYESWNNEHIMTWIMSLENGRFKKYKDILSKTLFEEDVKGIDLRKVDVMDLKSWGVVNFGDRKLLYEGIKGLVNGNHNNEDEPAPIANEEGAESGGYFN